MKTELLNGKHFSLNNENWCVENESDDFRGADVWFDQSGGWKGGFKILFNGELVHCSKTFPSLKKKLDSLISRWHLEVVTTEE